MNKTIIALVIGILTLVSCKSQKTSTFSSSPKKIDKENVSNKATFYNAILKKSDFDALKITSKIDASNIPNINAIIYIENNQKIWVNLSAFFINMARGIATPKGLKAYEKIDRTYIDSDFSYLNNLLNINFLDFNALQNLLLGRIFIPIDEKKFNLATISEGYSLKSKEAQKVNVNGKTNEYLMSFKFSSHFELNQAILQDTKSTDQLEIFYENWESINEQKFPKNVKIIIKGKNPKQILIENTKFEFSKMETPYSVPNNYKKRDL